MSLLSKLTFIIPTYNRHAYALRNMRYWSDKEVIMHVVDGSATPIPPNDLADLGANIYYHHLPISVHERLAYSISLIDTEYAALQGDDEFFSPDCLEKCIKELENDKELVSCMGRTIGFNPTSEGLIGRPWYSDMKDYTLMQDDPIERMVTHMGTYTCSTIYSVIRTPVWKHAMDAFSKHIFTVFSMEEYLFEMVVAFMGKSKVIPALYWFRSLENERIIQNENKFNVWWNRSSSSEEREVFINLMVDSLSEASDIDKQKLREGVIRTGDAFTYWADPSVKGATHIKPGIGKRIFSFVVRKMKGIRRRLSAVTDEKVKSNKKKMYPFPEAVDLLKKEGVSVNRKEITEIEEIVMDFYQTKQKQEALVHE